MVLSISYETQKKTSNETIFCCCYFDVFKIVYSKNFLDKRIIKITKFPPISISLNPMILLISGSASAQRTRTFLKKYFFFIRLLSYL